MTNEHYWQVEASIHGGTGYAPATREEYMAIAKSLENEAAGLEALAASWNAGTLQLQSHRFSAPMCPSLSADSTSAEATHASLPYTSLGARCNEHAAICRQLGQDLADTARLLIRAHSLYSDAELIARRVFTETLQIATHLHPQYALLGMGAVAAGGFLSGWAIDGRPNPVWMSTATHPFQEGVLSGFGAMLGFMRPEQGILSTNEVNKGAGTIAIFSGPLKDLFQGNHLSVQEVHTDAEVVRASSSVAESMENLRRLAEERLGKIELNSGLEYGTIAIQRYERSDGSNAWLVTIPGTDGQDDSPFGWEQNVELMSSYALRRRKADSARMVAEAMRQAGIGADEPVALIGHSQGGIAAAAIASDWADQYNIQHVVTAGSPIANHPIPERTWVTSVEIDDELVAALDGAANPAQAHWLTVSGHVTPAPAPAPSIIDKDGFCTPGSTSIAGSTPYDAARVAGGPTDGREISHWLKYHQAAYQNATDLGSPAVQRHEAHFQQVIDGDLKETHYYRGRMTRSAIVAPGERIAEFTTIRD